MPLTYNFYEREKKIDMNAVSCKKRMSRNKYKIRETTVRTRKAYSPSIDERRRQMDDPTSFLVFSVLGPDEQEYAQMLKEDIVKVRPEFDNIYIACLE